MPNLHSSGTPQKRGAPQFYVGVRHNVASDVGGERRLMPTEDANMGTSATPLSGSKHSWRATYESNCV